VLLVLAADTQVQAVVTSDQQTGHVVAPGDVAYGVNSDGVVQAEICTAALISDRHVLSAAHCFDTDGNGEVDSYLSIFGHDVVFDLPEGKATIEFDLESIQWPATWPDARADIAVVKLVQDAPPEAPRYPLYAGDQEVGRSFVLAAYGQAGYGAVGADASFDDRPTRRAGRNRYEAIRNDEGTDFLAYDFDSGAEANNSLTLLGFDSDLGFGADEVFSAHGDSGAPSFINGAIVAVTAWGGRLPASDVTDDLDSSWGELGFDTRVSAFRAFLEAATQGSARFVVDGDFDKNGHVDGGDFLVWQRQYGRTDFPAADGDGDGAAGASDFALWRDGFAAGDSTAPSTPVPEPTAAALLLGTAFLGRFARTPSSRRQKDLLILTREMGRAVC
jgi:hypothetical protein